MTDPIDRTCSSDIPTETARRLHNEFRHVIGSEALHITAEDLSLLLTMPSAQGGVLVMTACLMVAGRLRILEDYARHLTDFAESTQANIEHLTTTLENITLTPAPADEKGE